MSLQETSKKLPADFLKAWQQDLQVIQNQAMRIGRFAHELLEIARPRPLQQRWIDLKPLIEHCWHLLFDPSTFPYITYTLDIPDDIRIYGDPVRLEQVFTNLFKNALDAMPGGGHFHVAVTRLNSEVQIILKDTGIGMSEAILDKIWEPFFTTKRRGTGLGLSTVHRIIQAHRGTISVESVPDKGTTFTIRLPIQSPGEQTS